MKNYSKYQVATAIAILFHTIGLVGILVFKSPAFLQTTSLNLLLMTGLLLYTQPQPNKWFLLFFAICVVTGIGVEIIGISTGALFGNYRYGTVLGPAIFNVPLIIGANWFIVIYCCGIAISTLLAKAAKKLSDETGEKLKRIGVVSVMIDGATLAVLFDWLIEPVAVKMGYWQWLGNGDIPLFNYICWFVVSLLLLFAYYQLPFKKENKFAVNLLLIQAMFFILLRTFL